MSLPEDSTGSASGTPQASLEHADASAAPASQEHSKSAQQDRAVHAHKLDKWLGVLWRNHDFRTLWLSLTITHFGGQVTFLALPLTAALLLHATPTEMGILTGLSALPYAMFGLFTGVLIDRSHKLPLIIWADVGRGAVLLLIPIATWFNFLSMPILYVASFLVGLGGIVGWAAYQVFMTERIGRVHLVEANSRIALSDSAAQLVGPGIAGALIEWLTAPFAILLDAISFFVSALMLRGIPASQSDHPKQEGSATWKSIWGDAKDGLWFIWRNPILRSLAWSLGVWNFIKHAYLAVLILYATRDLALTPGKIGALFMAAGIGFLAASFFCQRLNERFGCGPVMIGGLAATGLAWVAIATILPGGFAAVLMGLALFAFDFGAMVFFINYLTLRQSIPPDRLLGRVTSTLIFLALALSPIGSVLGGVLGEWLGLRTTIGICGVSCLVLGVVMWKATPLAQMFTLPKVSKTIAAGPEVAAD